MTASEYIINVKYIFENELNSFLAGKSMNPISTFCNNAFDVEKNERSLAVYFASPKGTVLEASPNAVTASCTVEFYLNDMADADSVNECQAYFSAITEFIFKHRFSESDSLAAVQINRMDMNDNANGCYFLIESKLQSISDYDW